MGSYLLKTSTEASVKTVARRVRLKFPRKRGGRAPGRVRTAKKLGALRAGTGYPVNPLLSPCAFTSSRADSVSSPALCWTAPVLCRPRRGRRVPRCAPLQSISSPCSAGQQTLQANPPSRDRVTGACGRRGARAPATTLLLPRPSGAHCLPPAAPPARAAPRVQTNGPRPGPQAKRWSRGPRRPWPPRTAGSTARPPGARRRRRSAHAGLRPGPRSQTVGPSEERSGHGTQRPRARWGLSCPHWDLAGAEAEGDRAGTRGSE